MHTHTLKNTHAKYKKKTCKKNQKSKPKYNNCSHVFVSSCVCCTVMIYSLLTSR